ncbi:type II secretion system F family protein [Stieleria varia]|uniref:Bacterial type II secretion system protein F domain protein n=1 Tax=Stieleria varia TaxID=2528005 RepID=A0A5C6B2D4_9BACT|nr:type II secretion system F family protein [Stieleria varia]TWU06078.1 Bacterial type II secretion system protein F domain protein [Stieleria varia]
MSTLAPALIFASFAMVTYLIGRRLLVSKEVGGEAITLSPAVFFGDLTMPLSQVLPTTQPKRTQLSKDLLTAGDHRPVAVEDFLAKRNAGVLISLLAGSFILVAGIADGYELMLAIGTGLVCLLAYTLPRILLSGRASRRAMEIEKAIPDAMDMIAMSVQGGLPLATAIGQVSRRLGEIYPALAKELAIVCRQAESGAVEQAFDGFAKRIGIPEIVAWCAMMRQSQKLGGRLADSLRDYASRIRADRQNRAERSGNTASLKLLLPVVLFLAPPIAILLIGPAVIELRDFINREKGATQAAFEGVQDVRP